MLIASLMVFRTGCLLAVVSEQSCQPHSQYLFVVRKQHRPETLKKHLVNSQKSFKFVESDHGYILTLQYLGEFLMKNLKKYQSCFLKK